MDDAARKPPTTTTNTGAKLAGLVAHEPVLGLRFWETGAEWMLPDHDPITIGRIGCDLNLDWPSVSAKHAEIERSGPHLLVHDRSSKNHTFSEGLPSAVFQLVPSMVVGFGGINLVAFNARTQRVRESFRRFLGYMHSAQPAIETAQWASTRRHLAVVAAPQSAPLVFAQYIHAAAPAHTSRRITVVERVPGEPGAQRTLLDREAFATLVVRLEHLPSADHRATFFREIKANRYGVRLVLIVPPSHKGTIEEVVGSEMRDHLFEVDIPLLAERRPDEVSRILEAAIEFHAGAASALFTSHDHECLERQTWPEGHKEMEETITRLAVARRHGKRKAIEAAKELKLTKQGLSAWATRNGFLLK